MSDQTPRAIPVVDDAAPESLAEASFETDATGKRTASPTRDPDSGRAHEKPSLLCRAACTSSYSSSL